MTEAKKYAGSCHCGEVRFEVTTDLAKIITCNCSICSRTGWMMSFVPASGLTLLSGKEALTDYQFGSRKSHHPFCKSCGIHAFSQGVAADGSEMRGVNVRCLEGVDLASLDVLEVDGKSN